MATAVEMPKLSDTMEEGVLVSWKFDEGDEISDGDVIAQVETDKATMDLEAYENGVLLKRLVGEGESIPIGQLIAVIGEEGEDISDILAQYEGQQDQGQQEGDQQDGGQPAEEAVEEEEEAPPAGEEESVEEGETRPETAQDAAESTPEPRQTAQSRDGADSTNGRVKASPLARRMAGEEQLDLTSVEGSGPGGRIIKRDIEAALAERQEAPAAPSARAERGQPVAPIDEERYESASISQMRKTIARRLADSKYSAPHFYLTMDIDMGRAVESREHLNGLAEEQEQSKISYNDLITKAAALALRQHPDVNASYLADEGEIRRYNEVHIAVAVAIDEGLVTPVIRHADRKGLAQIARETKDLAQRARERTLEPADWEGSTFTTSNLGMFGIEEFTAIINPPNACILAIGGIRDVPVVEDGEIVPGKRMKVTLSCDHRIVDGATGARFLDTLQKYLEEPMNLLL